MWACLLVYLLISATRVTARKQIADPCSGNVLKLTVHGLITINGSGCNHSMISTIDELTNRIVHSIPQLSSHVYSIIVCPTTTTAECLYFIYIAETRFEVTASNSRLTRTSMTALQLESNHTVIVVEPINSYTNKHNIRVAYQIDDMMGAESSGSGDYDAGQSNNNHGLKDLYIILIGVGIFVVFCFMLGCLISVIQCKHRLPKSNHTDYPPLPITLDGGTKNTDGGTENFELYPLSPQGSKRVYRLSLKEPPLPVLTNLLSMHDLKKMLDDKDAIETEYRKLPPNTTSIEHIPEGTVYKNRYADIFPEPRTRVALTLQRGITNSDYINANYIRGYKMASKQYIATQGPMPQTVEDFWRLIWEQRCCTIVMLTNLIENDTVVKCHQYWPDERINRTSVYGELLVTIGKRQTEKDYMVTTFLVQHRDKAVNREITHFWFTSWPDHGIPKTTTPVIAFVREVRNHQAEIPGPTLVHCSAGIGRTGVFICFDIGMRQLEETNKVDILRIISVLRQDRGGMIQTSLQYHFVYKLLYDYGCYLQRISSTHLRPLEEFPSEVSDTDQSETNSQLSLHSHY